MLSAFSNFPMPYDLEVSMGFEGALCAFFADMLSIP